MFNPLQPGVAFLYPLKTSENLGNYGVFFAALGIYSEQEKVILAADFDN